MESFWAHLRRSYNGTHHHISPKHLHRYVTEAAERPNTKTVGILDRMEAVVRNMVGRTLTYKQLIGRNTLCGV